MPFLRLVLITLLAIVTIATLFHVNKITQSFTWQTTNPDNNNIVEIQNLRKRLALANELITNLTNCNVSREQRQMYKKAVANSSHDNFTTELFLNDPPSVSPTQSPTVDLSTESPTPLSTLNQTLHGRLINDLTLPWNHQIYRPWLDPNITKDQEPPAMILISNEGWNLPNQTMGLTFGRTIRETELFSAIVNHPWFLPRGWEAIESGDMPIRTDIRYYVFVDKSTCDELNYPHYGGWIDKNMDTSYNRSKELRFQLPICKDNPIFSNKIFSSNNNTKRNAILVQLDCTSRKAAFCPMSKNLPISVAAMSLSFDDILEDRDQGLLPPALKPVKLTKSEEEDIRSCAAEEKRQLHAVYLGNFRSGPNAEFQKIHDGARMSYKNLNDNKRIFVQARQGTADDAYVGNALSNRTYTDILRNTSFGLAPRGDNKFSYRFTEVLSAGAIPVYHGDGHVLPFRPELVDWNKCAIILPEKDAGNVTLDYIDKISTEERCKMRKYCYFGIYKKYAETPMGIVNGLITGLEILAKGVRKPFAGVRCNRTSIENNDCNPLRR